MSTMIQIRNVPGDLHRRLKARAALAGMSLSDYLLHEIRRAALEDLVALPLSRYPHDFLMSRVWDLRANMSAYDAVYVALAEALDAPLLTRDRRLAKAPGHRARVEVV